MSNRRDFYAQSGSSANTHNLLRTGGLPIGGIPPRWSWGGEAAWCELSDRDESVLTYVIYGSVEHNAVKDGGDLLGRVIRGEVSPTGVCAVCSRIPDLVRRRAVVRQSTAPDGGWTTIGDVEVICGDVAHRYHGTAHEDSQLPRLFLDALGSLAREVAYDSALESLAEMDLLPRTPYLKIQPPREWKWCREFLPFRGSIVFPVYAGVRLDDAGLCSLCEQRASIEQILWLRPSRKNAPRFLRNLRCAVGAHPTTLDQVKVLYGVASTPGVFARQQQEECARKRAAVRASNWYRGIQTVDGRNFHPVPFQGGGVETSRRRH
jgi:hypothetical protein